MFAYESDLNRLMFCMKTKLTCILSTLYRFCFLAINPVIISSYVLFIKDLGEVESRGCAIFKREKIRSYLA